jgi:hypothetical protein
VEPRVSILPSINHAGHGPATLARPGLLWLCSAESGSTGSRPSSGAGCGVVADTLGDGADRNDPREHRGAGYAVGHRRGHAHILGGMHRHRPWRFPLARSDRHSLLARDHRRTICLLHLDRAVPSSAQPAASDPTVSIRAVSRSLAVKAGGCAMGVPVRARLRTQPSASAVTHGQRAGSAQVLVALHAHQPSQADNAGSIPVTRSTPGQRRCG